MGAFTNSFSRGFGVQQGANMNIVFVSESAFSAAENQLNIGYVVANPGCIYSIVAGNDGSKFKINPITGKLTFNNDSFPAPMYGPDYLNPTDANTDNIYTVTVRATKSGKTLDQNINVTVTAIANNLKAARIGDVLWAKYNYNESVTPIGTVIPEIQDNTEFKNATTPAWCNYSNLQANGDVYGKIYNGYAVNLIKNDIEAYNAANPTNPYPFIVAGNLENDRLVSSFGGILIGGASAKETGTSHWNSPNTGATNNSGYGFLGGGLRLSTDGTFSSLKNQGRIWTGGMRDATAMNFMRCDYNNDDITLSYASLNTGMSLRLIKVISSDAIEFDTYETQRLADSFAQAQIMPEVQWYGYEYVEGYEPSTYDVRIASSISAMSLHASLPIQSKMKRCVTDKFSGEVLYYLDPNNSLLKADGVTPSVLDGTDGNFMVEIPEFFYKCTRSTINIGGTDYTKVTLKISEYCVEEDWILSRKCYTSAVEATINRTTDYLASVVSAIFTTSDQEVKITSTTNYTENSGGISLGIKKTAIIGSFAANAATYRGGVNNSAYDSSVIGDLDFERNQLGRAASNMNRSTLKSKLPKTSNLSIHKYDTLIALTVLYIVEYATVNAQKPFTANTAEGYKDGGTGKGATVYPDYNSFVNFWLPTGGISALPNGITLSLGNNTGEVYYKMTNVPLSWTSGTTFPTHGNVWMPVMSYRGVENFYGHMYKVIDQINIWSWQESSVKYGEVYYQHNPYRLSDSNVLAYTKLGDLNLNELYLEKLMFNDNRYSAISAQQYSNSSGKYGDFVENLLNDTIDTTKKVEYTTFNGRIVSGNYVGLFFMVTLYNALQPNSASATLARTSDVTRIDHF